jgi:hypothetical protein
MAEDFLPDPLVIATWSCSHCDAAEGLVMADGAPVAVVVASDSWQCERHGAHAGPVQDDAFACACVLALVYALVSEVTS